MVRGLLVLRKNSYSSTQTTDFIFDSEPHHFRMIVEQSGVMVFGEIKLVSHVDFTQLQPAGVKLQFRGLFGKLT